MVEVEEDEEAMDGVREEDDLAPGLLYPNEEGGGNEPAVEGRVSLEAGTCNFFRPSPPSPFPLTPFERVNNGSPRCLERSHSSLALDWLSLAAFVALVEEDPPNVDVFIIAYSLAPVESTSPTPKKFFESLGRGCR